VSKQTYHPDRGDLVELNFFPSAGREIDKRRPAIVLSPRPYNKKGGLCITVPITSDTTPGPLWIEMPAGYLPRPSLILCDYLKQLDYRERSVTFLAQLPKELVDRIVSNVFDVLDPI
jgi:mRNA interferase MazF